MSEEQKLITLYIDGEEAQVPSGTNVVEAAASIGKEIPHYCYHPHLSVSGNCRMCLVEMGMPQKDRASGELVLDEKGEPKIAFIPKPVIGCSTQVAPGMHIKTNSPMVKECQQGVMEFLLVNHPLDCPICDQAGECLLQEFAADYGRGCSRFVEEKNVKPKRTRLGPRVMLDDERCILCSRCVRFSREIAGDDVLGFVDRGSYSTLTCYPGRELEHNYSLNTVDICPVGALTSTDFRFKMRVWFLKPVKSICTESSVGVNTLVWSREGKIYRITPRRNDVVNDSWMSDSGRMLYKQVEADNRVHEYLVAGERRDFEGAIKAAAELLAQGKPAYVGSGHMSIEEQFLMRELRERYAGSVHFVHHEGEGDGLLISNDRTPNLRGGLLTGLIEALPQKRLEALGAEIDAGKVDTIFVHREDLLEAGLSEAQLAKVKILFLGAHANVCSDRAAVVLPGLTVFEKEGTFVNQQFRLQRFAMCVPPPEGLQADSAVLARLAQASCAVPDVRQLWKRMAAKVPVFTEISFEAIPEEGLLLDGSALAHLPFCEEKSLHFEPVQAHA